MSYVLPMVLHLLRARAGTTQAALALEVGVSASAVTQAENRDNAMQERVFSRYAQALGLTEIDALEEGIKLLRRLEAGASVAEMFPHLAKPGEAAPTPPKAARPSKVYQRPAVKKPSPPRSKGSKIAVKKARARTPGKKAAPPRARSRA